MTEEERDEWFSTHCQFCGNSNVWGDCGCDHMVRY